MSVSILAEVVASAIGKINEAEVFTERLRDELSNYSFQQPEEGSFQFTCTKSMYDGLLKNGDLEKFYQKYYATVPVKSTQFFTGLSRNTATLLSTKVADCLIAYCKRNKNSGDNTCSNPTTTLLSERERAGLQYRGGYVLQNLYKKHARTGTVESQQAMAILNTGKLDCIDDSLLTLIRIVSSTTPGPMSLVHGVTHDKSVSYLFSTPQARSQQQTEILIHLLKKLAPVNGISVVLYLVSPRISEQL